MLVLAAKLLLAPAGVVAATLVARRWGPRAGGLVGGLPVVGGPLLLVLALMHGRAFGSRAAGASLLGLVAVVAFVVVYGRLAARARPAVTVLAGWLAFLVAVAMLSAVHPPLGVAFAAACASFVAGLAALPAVGAGAGAPATAPRGDLAIRAAAALALVLAISAVSGSLGAQLSGLLAPFPILTAVLAVFTHHRAGAAEVQRLLRGFLVGFYGFAVFCFAVALALPGWSLGAAFGVAVLAVLAAQIVVAAVLGRQAARARRAAPPARAPTL